MDLQNKQVNGQPAQTLVRDQGVEEEMTPNPIYEDDNYIGTGKLNGKVALVTGGSSGIGRAVAIAYAKEGADVAIIYNINDEDALLTKERVEAQGQRCLLLKGDAGDEAFANQAVEETVAELGGLDVLVNNAGEQTPKQNVTEIPSDQMERTFKTNFFSFYYFSKKALEYMKPGSAIVNTASINAFVGNPMLVDYTSTKGAIIAYTRSIAKELASKGIRVNAVAPGPIWTPLIPTTFPPEQVKSFGKSTPMKRPGQPVELVGPYVLLASNDGSYMTGQTIHVDGGSYMSS
ncbi:SDR family oxidoreductase [Terrilactibacillus sp. BCM23-1]|uniref:SDR family oxidoreductase n=1 Tax=Terrilactibacillus tamarindi TaxID=2599694 RepID=A0A6N8CQJ4_9BACI|nr:SDR family oxidoreductase [Terrilactibacillus tamarindi]MTT31928.1 SDR family oxidoreductase [Terrilactibacillus tamarindi]